MKVTSKRNGSLLELEFSEGESRVMKFVQLQGLDAQQIALTIIRRSREAKRDFGHSVSNFWTADPTVEEFEVVRDALSGEIG